jgi:molybdopterin synthase sulfur carrier subunit
MSVRILFLGPLADLAGTQEREVAAPLDWTGLLAAAGPEIAAQLDDARDGDEVALLPPVSGG